MKRSLSLTLITALLTSGVFAQTVLYEHTFDNDHAGWSTTGMWHWIGSGDACTQAAQPFPSPSGAMRFGDDPGCDYDGNGNLQMIAPVAIPANASRATLHFKSYNCTEASPRWDLSQVFLEPDGSGTWSLIGEVSRTHVWRNEDIDLTQWAGQDVRIRFHFDVVDQIANFETGWLIDDVRIVMEDCRASSYCVAAPNSASALGARIGFAGGTQVHQNNFTLTVDDGPPGQFGFYFYGPGMMQLPIASGFICVAGDQFGYRRLYPGGQFDANGKLDWPIDFAALTGFRAITAGATHNFQCWYRDQMGGMNTSNFSDALSVTFCE